jgi:hypothetical protein
VLPLVINSVGDCLISQSRRSGLSTVGGTQVVGAKTSLKLRRRKTYSISSDLQTVHGHLLALDEDDVTLGPVVLAHGAQVEEPRGHIRPSFTQVVKVCGE